MKNRTITVFYDNTTYTLRWLSALVWAKKELKKKGLLVRFSEPLYSFFSINKVNRKHIEKSLKKKQYDIIFFAYHHISAFFDLDYISLLKTAKSHCNKLVWLDTSDSCGTCKFEVMPIVDLYLKKQIYVDKSTYEREVWGGRTFCEYYHKKTELDDDFVSGDIQGILPNQYSDKLRISWNVGLGNLIDERLKLFFNLGNRRYAKKYLRQSKKGNTLFDAHYRGSRKSPIAGYQRNKTIDILNSLSNDIRIPDPTKQVSKKQYFNEITHTKCVVSPFGWGEICTRDFEAFMSKTILVKPDMSHIDTFPNYFISNKTYLSVDWDLEQLPNALHDICSGKFNQIALCGSNLYLNSICEKGKEEFANHLMQVLDL